MSPSEDIDTIKQTWARWPKLRGLHILKKIQGDNYIVPAFIQFDVGSWVEDPEGVYNQIVEANDLGNLVAVRSCALLEDEAPNIPPGQFRSVLNVKRRNREDISKAINTVASSYQNHNGSASIHVDSLIIVQSFVAHARISGVARFVRDPTGYVEVDFDDVSTRTDTITNGSAHRRFHLRTDGPELNAPWEVLRRAHRVIMPFMPQASFVEFAIDSAGNLYLFQIRNDRRELVNNFDAKRSRGERDRIFREMTTVLRRDGPLSNMADWNPAEMLGKFPNPLDISLYQKLLLDDAWQLGRATLGWNTPKDTRLLVTIAGRPYISLRKSLESLLPNEISERMKVKLINDRLMKIQDHPSHHDKIEFEIIWSASAHSLQELKDELCQRGFDQTEVAELHDSLSDLTHRTLVELSENIDRDELLAKELIEFLCSLTGETNRTTEPKATFERIALLIDKTITLGAVPFSRQARAAFMLKYIIDYLLKQGAISASEVDNWFRALGSVASRVSTAIQSLQSGEISRELFNSEFGHLRPGTYNILASRYDETDELIGSEIRFSPKVQENYEHNFPQSSEAEKILNRIKPGLTQLQFWALAAKAIRSREELKFQYSKAVSSILRQLDFVAAHSGLSKEELSFLTIDAIQELLHKSTDWKMFTSTAKEQIIVGKRNREEQKRIRTPDVIFVESDLSVVADLVTQPTYIGSGTIRGEQVRLTTNSRLSERIDGKIILLQSADPGFMSHLRV